MAKIATTFETGCMLCRATSFKNISRAHMQGAEMSTIEERFLRCKQRNTYCTGKELLYGLWQLMVQKFPHVFH